MPHLSTVSFVGLGTQLNVGFKFSNRIMGLVNLGKRLEKYKKRYCETKVWLILILMITKQGLELIIIFQV